MGSYLYYLCLVTLPATSTLPYNYSHITTAT